MWKLTGNIMYEDKLLMLFQKCNCKSLISDLKANDTVQQLVWQKQLFNGMLSII